MARAKRTDRAEARRRYRAEMAGIEDADDGVEPAAERRGATPRQGAEARKYPSPSGRIGMGAAFRQSIHPVNLRADLAALPWLVTHTKAFWLPALIRRRRPSPSRSSVGPNIVTALRSTLLRRRRRRSAAVFLAGFLAPRASWLLGAHRRRRGGHRLAIACSSCR